MTRHISGRRLNGAVLVSVLVMSLLPVNALGAPIPAHAALLPVRHFVGDSTGRLLTFRVRNSGTVDGIGSVRIEAPSSFWTETACPSGPAGWTRAMVAGACEYTSAPGNGDDIPLAQGRYFKLRATTAGSDHNVWGTWRVKVSPDDDLADVADAAPMGLGLRTRAFTFEVVDAVIADSAATAGDPCPAPDKTADAGSTGNFVIVCGRNHGNTTLTPVNANSKLLGSMIASHGVFTGGPVPSSNDVVVLGYWSNVTVTSNDGAGKAVRLRVGSADDKTSPVRRIAGFTAEEGSPPVGNTAPVLDASKDPLLSSVSEDPGPPLNATDGTQVSALIDLASPTGQVDNVSDPDGPGLGIAIVGGASTGTLWYSTNNGASWNNAGAPSGLSNSNALLLATETGNNRIYYQPAANANGVLSGVIVIRAWDESTGTSGSAVSIGGTGGTTAFSTATDNVGMLVNAVNDAPFADDDSTSTTLTTPINAAAPGVLAGDTDADGNSLTAILVSGPSHAASFFLNSDGSFSYTAVGGYEGSDSFTYKANDGSADSNVATVSITVNGSGGGGGGGGCLIVC